MKNKKKNLLKKEVQRSMPITGKQSSDPLRKLLRRSTKGNLNFFMNMISSFKEFKILLQSLASTTRRRRIKDYVLLVMLVIDGPDLLRKGSLMILVALNCFCFI